MLQRLETRNFTVLNKAWVAFKEHVQSPAARLTSSFRFSTRIRNSSALITLASSI